MNKIFRVFDINLNSYIADDELFINNFGEVFSIHPMDGELIQLNECVVEIQKTVSELDISKYYN